MTETGSDTIRAALQARTRKSLNEATVAKDLGIAAETLRGFADGRRTLPPDVMSGLVKVLFHGHAEWDAEHDALKPAYREPATPLGIHPPAAETKPVGHTGPPPPQSGSPDSFAHNDITKPYQKPAGWREERERWRGRRDGDEAFGIRIGHARQPIGDPVSSLPHRGRRTADDLPECGIPVVALQRQAVR